MIKPFKTIDEQLNILTNRGLIIDNIQMARECLQAIGYYKLSGYFFHKQKKDADNQFIEGTTFDQIYRIYEFDRMLRMSLLQPLEIIEISMKALISYNITGISGSTAHYCKINFYSEYRHKLFLEDLEKERQRNMTSVFIAHHEKKYKGVMPLWVAFEIISFSSLSMFYNNLRDDLKRPIAKYLSTSITVLPNWLHCLSILRNICSHSGRIYNRPFSKKISLHADVYTKYPDLKSESFSAYLIILSRLLPSSYYRDSFLTAIHALVSEFDDCVEPMRIGLPNDWKKFINDIRTPH